MREHFRAACFLVASWREFEAVRSDIWRNGGCDLRHKAVEVEGGLTDGRPGFVVRAPGARQYNMAKKTGKETRCHCLSTNSESSPS